MQIKHFDDQIDTFFAALDTKTFGRTMRMLEHLERAGSTIRMPYSKKVSDRLYELRIYGATQIRILYTYYDSCILLLHAFCKKSMRIPKRELRTAKRKLRELDPR